MSTQRTIGNLAVLGVLELYMYVLYASVEREAQRIKSGNGDGSVTVEAADAVYNLAVSNGRDEFEDIRNISKFIEARCESLKIEKTASTIINQEIAGNFLTLRRFDIREELAKRFYSEAVEDDDAEIVEWLTEVMTEEQGHEEKIHSALKLLDFEYDTDDKLIPYLINEDVTRHYLMICFEIIFAGRHKEDGINYLVKFAKQNAGSKSDRDLLVSLLVVALCLYWSYCNAPTT